MHFGISEDPVWRVAVHGRIPVPRQPAGVSEVAQGRGRRGDAFPVDDAGQAAVVRYEEVLEVEVGVGEHEGVGVRRREKVDCAFDQEPQESLLTEEVFGVRRWFPCKGGGVEFFCRLERAFFVVDGHVIGFVLHPALKAFVVVHLSVGAESIRSGPSLGGS